MTIEELQSELDKLDVATRATLAQYLIESLDPAQADEGAEEAWVEELNRREDEIRTGRADGQPVAEFMAEMFRKHA